MGQAAMEFNAPFFHEFSDAWSGQEGPRLSQTLSPDLPTEKLRKICDSQNAHDIKNVLKRGLQGNAALLGGMDSQEIQGWVEVYAAYWHAIRSILTARNSSNDKTQVSIFEHATAFSDPRPSFSFVPSSILTQSAAIAVGMDKGLRVLDRVDQRPAPGLSEQRLRSLDPALLVRGV